MITTDVDLAAKALRTGGLVAFPTETVYGLGVDATSADALARLYAVKRRPRDHPSIIHLPDAAAASDGWSATWPASAERLAAALWPGPLTLILPAGERPDPAALGGTATVALRVPASALARELIRLSGTGVAAPSANRFGRVSPTTAQHVDDDLGADVDVILDGGPCTVGVESTIVDLTGAAPRILRPGAVTRAHIEQVLGCTLGVVAGTPPRAPGTLAAHYAPMLPVTVVDSLPAFDGEPAGSIALITLHAADLDAQPPSVRAVWDAGDDATTYAERLYALLRSADTSGADRIVAVLPAAGALGDAVRDRLCRAAASS